MVFCLVTGTKEEPEEVEAREGVWSIETAIAGVFQTATSSLVLRRWLSRARSGRNAISRTALVEWNKGVVVAGTRTVPCLKRRATCLWNPLRSRRGFVGCAQWVEEKQEQETGDRMALSQAVPQTGDETRS